MGFVLEVTPGKENLYEKLSGVAGKQKSFNKYGVMPMLGAPTKVFNPQVVSASPYAVHLSPLTPIIEEDKNLKTQFIFYIGETGKSDMKVEREESNEGEFTFNQNVPTYSNSGTLRIK
ncbi:hypothetical protein H6P81_014052 [Aristolochia fimbriata]|uniref:Uncharacterized protein n=1 Tax=Aristolochia fimbriata TaxID=158543 RepID=A0AAV7EHZ6_ARIFI|nr:hypothetical protein H6P81_014052 [Aristolochia fimbriata]